MPYKDKFCTRQYFDYRARMLDQKGTDCENCDSDCAYNIVPKGFIRGFEPWEYDAWQVRVLCEECRLDVRNRCREFLMFCDSLPGLALAHLLDGLDTFRALEPARLIRAEDVYSCLKGIYRTTTDPCGRPPYRVTKIEMRNFLMGSPTAMIYPIIDGLEILQRLPAEEQISRASKLKPLLTSYSTARSALQNAYL